MESKKSNKQKTKKNHKILIIVLSVVFLVFAGIGIYTFLYIKQNKDILFELNGSEEVTINLLDEYFDEGYTLKVNNKSFDAKIKSNIENTKVGTYKITYNFTDKFKLNHKITRIVNVIDNIAPDIELVGNKEVTLLVGDTYEEAGYVAIDNYDSEDSLLVEITDCIDTSKVGTYKVTYKVTDMAGNCTYAYRTINVVAPKKEVVYVEPKVVEKVTIVENIVAQTEDNTVTKNKFTNTGIYYEGYFKGGNGSNVMHLKNDSSDFNYEMTTNGEYYSGNITFDNVPNGTYKLYINDEELKNSMEFVDKIARAKVGNKLVEMNYNNGVSLTVSDFAYQYDILIDVGHGGSDNGASNAYMYEKNMNLIQSRYEKCRYEEMGLSVLMVRNDDTYGSMMGPSNLKTLTRRAYYMGYYGVVSKIVYSNHHNSSPNKNSKGYEILTPAQFDSLQSELNIANQFNSYYVGMDNHVRMYARNYDTGGIYSSMAGQSYNFKNYYCVIRIPYELFNTKVVIYEGTYLSNLDDFNWYWTNGNWKGTSEIKIKEYVTSLGYTYSEATSCN